MNFKNKFLLVTFSLSISLGFSQNVEFTKENFKDRKDELKAALKDIEKGDEFMNLETYYFKNAIPLYLNAYNLNPNNAVLNYHLGKAYLYSNFKEKAIDYLIKAIRLNPQVAPDINLYLGMGYQIDMQWDMAVDAFNKHLSILHPKDDTGVREDIQLAINQCNNGKEISSKPIRVKIDNVGPGVNSPYPDYSPVITADESVMLFTSRRPETTGGSVDPLINEPFEDIYIAERLNGVWGQARNMGTNVNTDGHDSNCGLSADGQKFLVYKDVNRGDVFVSELEGSEWTKPDKLNKNINTEYHESSSCFSPDGNSIYFVSDKPEVGLGGRDIYLSTKDAKGRWGEAVNIGSVINTPLDEEGVYLHPDGKTLYFSSKGHNSMGGYDVFKSVLDEQTKSWSEPQNIGYPVNTTDDDVFFTVSASGKHAYYSSIRPGGFGEKDVYRITFLGDEKRMLTTTEDNLIASLSESIKEDVSAQKLEVQEAQLTLLKGVILDDKTNKPISATIEIIDNAKNEVIASFKSNSVTGKYLVSMPAGKNYGISVRKDDYLFHSENFDLPKTAEYNEVSKDIKLKNIAVGNSIVLKNIFFDFNKATLRKESENEIQQLTKLLMDVPTMKIEISGHTDNRGSDEYNKNLSNQRAKAVYDRLIEKGIDTSRMTFMGYGEEKPIATNDTEEGRQLNRRTEFKVLAK
jgi:outer membrane protein OmpA-like peptidoglycan-associated protein/tetratricopeptide (TPR) repeat protein